MVVQPRIIASAVRIKPLYFGSRWECRSDAYRRFPLRFAWLPMELVRRHWLASTHLEQRFASHNHRWDVQLAIDAKSVVAPKAPGMTHERQTFMLERSTFTREHLRHAVLSNLLQVYRQQSILRIEREHAHIAGILEPAIRTPEPHSPLPSQRACTPVIPAMAAAALTRIERIESVLTGASCPQRVTRPVPPTAPLAAASPTSSAPHSTRAVPEPRPPATPAMSPVDLERLTDRLMRNIDRRLVASRERIGRI